MINFIKPFTAPLFAMWKFLPFTGKSKPFVTVLPLTGMIGAGGPGSRPALNYARLEKSIEAAFKPDNLTAVALSINSPGGSPVQSKLIFSSIRRLAEKKDVPVLAFIEDLGASGGYMLAVAGDEIFADECSIVGSIGVISGGFGFPAALEKLGVERRVYTAGTNKSQLDAFAPEKPKDVAHLKTILNDTHEKFVAMVKSRRGDKLDLTHKDIFTGSFWTASGAKQRGLIDDTGHLDEIIAKRYGDNVRIKKCEPQSPSILSKFMGSSKSAVEIPNGSSSKGLVDLDQLNMLAQERALFSRYGL